jgi:hypothetical protein
MWQCCRMALACFGQCPQMAWASAARAEFVAVLPPQGVYNQANGFALGSVVTAGSRLHP